ncbi:phage tail tape measure protein [bacterium 1xD8-6]|nr:phage tail tape measure protein [bacterium D16-36]RKI63522.1 phage tail tape measure protein [bacterium 1xD8-6]
MEENEFMLKLVAMQDKAKSKKQVNSDIKELEKVVRNLRLTATLAKGTSKQQIKQTIRQLESQISHIKLQAKIDQKNLKSDIDKALQNISFKDLKDIDINVDGSKAKLKVQKALADVKKAAQNTPISVNVDLKKEKLNNQLTTYLSKNSKIRESEPLLKEADKLREKIAGINDRDSLRDVTDSFQLFKSECSATGYQAKSTSDRIKSLVGNVTKVGSAFGVASMAISNYQKSLKTIKTNDDILTEISKTSNSTKQELEELGNSAFDTASKFGKVSSDYLTAIEEMNRSGFYGEAGKALGELTLLTQAAGDVTAEVAQKYLLSTNAAYGYAGSVEKLTNVLDGQNYITNRHSVDMETMATATEKAGSMAANTGVKIEELSAMIGTISARTKEAGTITGTGIKALLVNLQNISSDKITGTLDKANASMTETVDGIEKLRTPIAILKDLAKTYNSLDENDPLKSEITTNIGGKHHANQLSALLSGWADCEKMLVDYSNGAGSALEEADKSANNLTGRLNALQNSWDESCNGELNVKNQKGKAQSRRKRLSQEIFVK